MRDVGIHRQPRKQRNLDHIRTDHHVGQPDRNVSNIPEIKIRGGIEDAGLQAERPGRQDAVDPDADMFGQCHVYDDWQDTEQKCRR